MTEDEVRQQIDRLTAEIDERVQRRADLRKLLSFPTVTPVLVYWRHHRRYEDPAMGDDSLEDAAKALHYMEEDGHCSAEGVAVGGALISIGDLRERFTIDD